MKLIPWLLLVIAIAVIIFMSQCRKQPAVVIDNHKVDSVIYLNAITIATLHDTITALKVELGANEIELNRGLAGKEDLEHKAGVQIAGLTVERNKYMAALSVRDSINACNEYMKRAAELYKSGQSYVSTINKLVKDGRERLRLDSLSGLAKDKAIVSIQSQFKTTAASLKSATGLLGKYQQNDKKRFVVGPFVGIAYTGKFQPVVGVGITYRLFRF